MKLKIKTEGLEGESLKFATALNEALDGFPEGITQDALNTSLESVKNLIPKETVSKTEANDMIDALKTIVANQGIEINTLKTQGANFNANLSLKDAIEKELTGLKAQLTQLKSGDIKQLGEIRIKAAATMTVAANAGSYIPQPQFIPGLTPLVRNTPFLLDYLPSQSASSARIVWMEKTNPQGNALMTAEGAVKPLISFQIVARTSDAKKVADKIKVSNEMLDDIPFIASEINTELKYQVDMTTDAQLLSGDGAGANLKGITQYASLYVLTTIKTPSPNDYDAMRAVQSQAASLNFNLNYIFINPIDGANMDLTKAVTSGVYMLPPFTTADGRRVGAMQVIETNQIPQGSFLAMDTTKAKVYKWMEFVIKVGYVNDDFEKNLVTIIGEQRLHFFIPQNYVNGFIYDTFANVKTAITPA